MNHEVVLETNLPLPVFKKGKVREVYDLGDRLLVVASDRISAYDSILPNGIPDKGRVLTQLSLHWFARVADIAPNHLITADVSEYPAELVEYSELLAGRSMIVKKAEVYPIECVARGYLAGSGWREYKEEGTVCGVALPGGLVESGRLPETIFTPATKAESGHDVNISFQKAAEIVGEEVASRLRDLTIKVYEKAAAEAAANGVIIADTKFEFGEVDGQVTLVDEVLTPDSSRFWPKDQYKPGGPQPSFDKQYVRDYLDEIGWDHNPPPPELSLEVIEGTSRRYKEAFEKITGKKFE